MQFYKFSMVTIMTILLFSAKTCLMSLALEDQADDCDWDNGLQNNTVRSMPRS